MKHLDNIEFYKIQRRKNSLTLAVKKGCSSRWILQLWSRFIKERDLHRCVNCESTEAIQAHHIVRKTLYPWGFAETGNGITLCRQCHRRVHEKFNGRADLSLPIGEGDDQDEWAFLFGLLLNDATKRGLNEDDLYFIDNHMLKLFFNIQGYEELYKMVMQGEISRIRFAHEIFYVMPEIWYTDVIGEIIRLNL